MAPCAGKGGVENRLWKENAAVRLAGVAGIEPANGGTKNRCLTTWLHPSRARPYNARVTNVKGPKWENQAEDCLGAPLGVEVLRDGPDLRRISRSRSASASALRLIP